MLLTDKQACCFAGHRHLPLEMIGPIIKRLDRATEDLIAQGVTDFLSGGALGFDQTAASFILAKREMGRPVRLIFALSCRDHEKFWGEAERELYFHLLGEADEIVYLSDRYSDGCMKQRDRYLIERSSHCVCALLNPLSGTEQAVRCARRAGVTVINVAEL